MNRLTTLSDLLAAAKRAGADAADALLVSSASLSVKRRMRQIEQLERSEGVDIGLRVFIGQRQAIVSSTDPDPRGFAALAERAVAMARVVPEDPFAGLPALSAIPPRDLDLHDAAEPSAEALLERAALAEEAALAVAGVTNSEGADAGWGRTEIALAASNGFAGGYVRTSHSISATALAGSGTGMERDYDWSSTVHLADLDDPVAIGRRAGGTGGAPAQPDTAEDGAHPGGLRCARRRQPAGPPERGDQRRGGGARHVLPEGPDGRTRAGGGPDRARRPAAPARPALAPLRRGGHAGRKAAPSSMTAC